MVFKETRESYRHFANMSFAKELGGLQHELVTLTVIDKFWR